MPVKYSERQVGLMTDLILADAAYLPSIMPHGIDAWAVYVSGAATHIWTEDEIREVSRYPKLPIAVTRPDKSGTFCGLEFMMAAYKLGIPRGTAVAADLELLAQKCQADGDMSPLYIWIDEFYRVMVHFGYVQWNYGSISYLFECPPCDGFWVATNSHDEIQYPHRYVHATQWIFDVEVPGGTIDKSLIHRIAVHHRLSEIWKVNHS